MSDAELEQRVREALADGRVREAEQWADAIEDVRLRRQMLALIREYEGM